MFKKSLIICAIYAIGSPCAIARGKPPVMPPHSFNAYGYTYQADPYLGLSVGPRLNTSSTPFTYWGVEGTLSAGLSHIWEQRIYLAGEVFFGDSARIKTVGMGSSPLSINNVESDWSVGFDLIPGLMFNQYILGYLRLGVVNTHFEMDSTAGQLTDNLTGFHGGLGLQTSVYKNIDARVEYILSLYQTGTNPPIGTMNSNQVNLGLVYKFP